MAAPLKISARVEIDANPAKQGAAASVAAVDTIGAAAERNTTKLQAMIAASVGLKSGAANQNVREWTGALAMQGKSIDELRAKYNPLFATIGQYKAALVEIRTLHAQGVLSTNEMTAAIQRQRQAALASIDAIKGRNQALRADARPHQNYAATNAMFQFQDIAVTAAMGMSPSMIALQQGSQLAGSFAGMGVKEAASATGAALAAMVSPISLVAIGLTGAAAAAIQFGSGLLSSSGDASKLDQVLERHSKTVEMLAERWGDVLERSSQYGLRSSAAIGFSAEMSSAQMRKSLRDQVPDVLSSITSMAGQHLDEIGGARAFRQQPMFGLLTEEVSRLVEAARNGSPDIVGLSRRISELARESNNSGVRKLADDVVMAIGPIEELARKLQEAERYRSQLFSSVGPNGMVLSHGDIAQEDGAGAALFESRERVAAERRRRALDAQLYNLTARSPEERAEAARRSAAAQYQDETASARRLRIEEAGTLALAQAEKELADARRDRGRALDQTLGQQQLELSLIGKTVGEQERLRMQFRLTAELKAEAARNGTQIDAAELARVQQLSAEYGKLAEQMVARRALDGQDQELAALRVRLSLVGQTEDVRTLAIANLETERRLRELGIALGSREAAQYREKAQLIAVQTEQLRKQEAAWETIRSTGENTIDTLFDKLSDGDWKGALEDIAKDWSKTILQLGAANPLKNAWLGTNLPTLDDVGGLGGMFSKLFGGGMSTASMSVNAATVSINGGIAGGLGGLLGVNDNFKPSTTLSSLLGYSGAANDNGKTASIFPATDIASYIRQAATVRGIDPSVALAVARSEGGLSSWNLQSSVIRNGVREPSFGPYQLYMGGGLGNAFQRQTGLDPRLAANGPAGVDFALDYASKNGWGAWYGARNTGISNWQGIGAGGSASAQRSLWSGIESKGTAAVASLDKLAGKSGVAADGLGLLGSGFDQFGKNLTNLFPAAPSGGSGGGFFSKLFGGLFGGLSSYGNSIASSSAQFASAWSLGGIGLFAKGGVADEPSIFGEAGPEAAVPLPDGRTIPVTLNVRQAYRTPQAANHGGGASSGAGRIVINNYSSAKVEAEESTDERGARQTVFTISEVVGAAVAQKGGKAGRTFEQQYGLRRRGINR